MLNTDQASFSKLYDLCAPTAYSLACRMLGNKSEAEDVVQHAFVSLWRHADEFDAEKGRVTTWLYVFVRNRCIDVIRRRKIEKAVPIDAQDEDAPAFELPDHSAALDAQMDEKERKTLVVKALGSLPEPQKRVIEAAYFEGMTQQEIADRHKEPLGTVKTRMRLGLMKLTEILKGQVSVL